MNERFSDQQDDALGIEEKSSESQHQSLLDSLLDDLLKAPVDPGQPLVAQGLDSMMAAELLEKLNKHGLDAPYTDLLDNATIRSLASSLRAFDPDGPKATPHELALEPVPLTGPQKVWDHLEEKNWGSWSNISLCLSVPASVIPAAFLPAMVQSLCEANDAMRMVLVPAASSDRQKMQQIIPGFQVSVQMLPAPGIEKEAMRLIEAFEGEEISPYKPSTRVLILSSPNEEGRHWLCLSMHHLFSDRMSMRSLERQIRGMITRGELHQSHPPTTGYLDYALWQSRILDEDEVQRSRDRLGDLLSGADTSSERPIPRLAHEETLDLGPLPTSSNLRPAEGDILSSLAAQMETTLPLFLHTLLSVLVARLTGDEKALSGNSDLLLCHVVSNRESDGSLRDLVGCLDTSIPVAVRLMDGETLASLCAKTRHAFSEAHRYAPRLPRGAWFENEGETTTGTRPVFFERVAHLNVLYSSAEATKEEDTLDIQVHPIRRVQKTRWGLAVRITLPTAGTPGTTSAEPSGISIQAFAEHRPLAIVSHDCFVRLLRTLVGKPKDLVGEVAVLDVIDEIVAQVRFASAQVRRAAGLLSPKSNREAFIWDKLVARQQRWYQHDERRELLRDESNRFIGTAANPFPFTQLDKLKERRFLDGLDVPQPRLLHVLPREGMPDSLQELAPSLPESFAIKPVGAGHSFGVTLVRDGKDLTRNGASFEVATIAGELTEMASRGSCKHEGHVFPFNFSSFLIEELVIDEKGFDAPTDYKIFMIGEKLLWIQVHFKADGHTWVAFVDESFELLPQPAWDPQTCWRTHRALVCTEQEMISSRRPRCLPEMIEQSKRLGSHLNLFVRLDWYADRKHGPLMGEMTTFPHMLQPRSFYSEWANEVVKAVWQDPDGVAPMRAVSERHADTNLVNGIRERLCSLDLESASLQGFLPAGSPGTWDKEGHIAWDKLHHYLNEFDLASWGVAGGDCVALLLPNGLQLGGILLATMNRYLALPLGPTLPDNLLIEQLRESSAKALLVVVGMNEADRANKIAAAIPDLVVIELNGSDEFRFATLPNRPEKTGPSSITPTRGPDDIVLALRTSGTTGEPKIVSFTLSRLILGGALISQSLELSPDDQGLSMLPLHHVGGISCNLIAPILAGSPMRFLRAFDPKAFFDGLAGPDGATWCYLVSTMWEMVLVYADSHPELRQTCPWPRLRLIRSAGSDLPHHIALKLADLFGDRVAILPTYGMTEAMPVAAPPASYRLEQPGSVGPVLPAVSVEIVGPSETGNLAPVSDGIIGEITVKGPTVFSDEGSSNLFTPRGYYRTGDLGKLASDGLGWLFVTGRIKDAINRGGETIAPAEIETVLKNYSGWQEKGEEPAIMVFARAHVDLQEDIALAIAPSSCSVDLADLNSWASRHLPPSMLPQTMIRMSNLPRSESGKLLRARFSKRMSALLGPARLGNLQTYKLEGEGSAPELVREQDAPHYRAEALSLGSESAPTFESLLEVLRGFVDENVELGPDTRLEDAGVNSLAAVELAGRLSARFSISLPPWIISDYQTPRALISQLTGRPQENSQSAELSHEDTKVVTTDRLLERPHRILFLHGEAADAELMDLSMQAAHWSGMLDGQVEFLFIDAPHRCGPEPKLHRSAVESGLYQKREYRSWKTTQTEALEMSIEATLSVIDEQGPVDGIGGVCEGGLVAALVAARRPEIKFYLNIASSPPARLASMKSEVVWPVVCPSLHLLSPNDELFSYQELLEIPSHCQKATMIQHPQGHCVPKMDAGLKSEVLAMLQGVQPGPPEPLPQSEGLRPVHHDRTRQPSSLEKELSRIWQKVLKMDHEPGLDDHFLELGGTSLESVILLREISRHFEREFSASLLINLSTIRQLARAIETADDDQPQLDLEPETSDLLEDSGLPVEVFYQLVSLTSWWRGERTRPQSLLYGQNTDSTRVPLFYCPATSTDFDDMAVALGPEQPVYGMRSGHLVMERTHSNLETLARYYVGEILSVQPNGRYIIAGYCRGVKLAFQIALELRRRGRQVGGLFLLEQTIPIWYPGRITLFFGRESFYNPERSFEGVEEKLKLFYPDHLAIRTLPGDHDAFWQKPSVDTFVSQLQAEIDEATSASPLAIENQDRKSLLPPEAHQAKIQTTKRLFVTPGEKKIRIKVRITNTSPVTWPSGNENGPVLGYWIKAVKMPAPIFHDLGQSVPASLAPGESIVMPLEIQLPKRGKRYVIIIDLVDNRFKWFQFGGSPVATIKLLSHFVFAPFTWMRKACRLISR